MGPAVIVSPTRRLQNGIESSCEEAWHDTDRKVVEYRGVQIQRVNDQLSASKDSVHIVQGTRGEVERALFHYLH